MLCICLLGMQDNEVPCVEAWVEERPVGVCEGAAVVEWLPERQRSVWWGEKFWKLPRGGVRRHQITGNDAADIIIWPYPLTITCFILPEQCSQVPGHLQRLPPLRKEALQEMGGGDLNSEYVCKWKNAQKIIPSTFDQRKWREIVQKVCEHTENTQTHFPSFKDVETAAKTTCTLHRVYRVEGFFSSVRIGSPSPAIECCSSPLWFY